LNFSVPLQEKDKKKWIFFHFRPEKECDGTVANGRWRGREVPFFFQKTNSKFKTNP